VTDIDYIKLALYATIVFTLSHSPVEPLKVVTNTNTLVEQKTSLKSPVITDKQPEVSESTTKNTVMLAEVSYYTASLEECGKTNGITASGSIATEGRTIAMSEDYPFGTKVIIDGQMYTVEDRGGYITKNRIDVYCEDYDTAIKNGRKYMEVIIVNE